MKVKTDYRKAKQVFGKLLEVYQKNEFPYNVALLPQRRENIPESIEWGSTEHAIFLFIGCYYMRGTITSEAGFKYLKKMYQKVPHIFDPKWPSVTAIPEAIEEVIMLLNKNGLGFNANETARNWVNNSLKIATYWDGDPVRIFDGVTSYDEALKRIKNIKFDIKSPFGFYGFREKMVSMIVYFYLHAGMLPRFNFPVPVDFHVLRVLSSHKVLIPHKFELNKNFFSDDLQKAAREVTLKYCEDEKVDSLHLSDVLWLLSAELCNQYPGNMVTRGQYLARKTTLTLPSKTWPDSAYERFKLSCGRCPVEKTCVLAIPSAYYYIHGKLLAIDTKRHFPEILQTTIFDE